MKQNFTTFLMILFFSVTSVTLGQTINGIVKAETDKPLQYAAVAIEHSQTGTVTNQSGKFSFSNAPTGNVNIIVSYIGYKKQTKSVHISPNEDIFVEFKLQKANNHLTGIDVYGDQKKNTPGEIKKIDRSFLTRAQAKDMKDIFIAEPSVTIGGGGRNAQRIYLRGVEGSNLRITIDGASQGRSLFQHRGNITGLDPSLLKQVQVSGMSGADNGPGSLGGSISFETIDAQDLARDNQKFGATIRTGFSSVSEGYRGGASVYSMINKKTGILIDISGEDQENYRTGDGDFALYTATEDWNLLTKLTFISNEHSALRASFSHNENAGHYISGGSGSDMGVPTEDQEASYQEMDRNSYTMDYRLNPGNKWINIKANINLNERKLENFDSGMLVESRKLTGSVKNTSSFNVGVLTNKMSVGMDYETEDGTAASAEEQGGNDVTNTSANVGVFAQMVSEINNFALIYGARFDSYDSDMGPKKITGNEISPNINARYRFLKNITAHGGYSQSVRAAGIIPIQWMSRISNDVVLNNGEAISPEASDKWEAGLKYKKDQLMLKNDLFDISATWFKTTITNMIDKLEGGSRGAPITAIYNTPEDIITEGYELKTSWKTPRFSSTLSFIHTDTKDQDGNAYAVSRRKAASMGDRLTGDLNYYITNEMEVGYTVFAVAKLKDVYETNLPGYTIHNLQFSWNFATIKGLKTSLAINNLFNESYSEQTSIARGDAIVTEPGRDVRISVRYSF